VRDGETVMLGGMISANKANSKGGVPILKDIPYLGALFRSTRNSEDRQELVVLIRPTVLPTPEAAANFARDQRRTLPGTSAAQREFDESERKLADEEEKRAADWQKKEDKRLKKKEEKEGFSK
jgi:type II secretory pathway component GspD/PulD (secretin)